MVAKAKNLRASIQFEVDPHQPADLDVLVFSQGWVSGFQKRHDLSAKRAHGEAASASSTVVE